MALLAEAQDTLNRLYCKTFESLLRGIDCREGHRAPTPNGCAHCGFTYQQAAEAEVNALLPDTFEDEPDEIGIYHRLPEDE